MSDEVKVFDPKEIAVDQICDLWCVEVNAPRPTHHAPYEGTIRERAKKIVDDLLTASGIID